MAPYLNVGLGCETRPDNEDDGHFSYDCFEIYGSSDNVSQVDKDGEVDEKIYDVFNEESYNVFDEEDDDGMNYEDDESYNEDDESNDEDDKFDENMSLTMKISRRRQ